MRQQYDITKKVSNEEYGTMVKEASPKSRVIYNCIKAFFVGGFICVIGQLISNQLTYFDFSVDKRAMGTSIGVLGLYSFDPKEFLRIAPRCRNIYGINTCHKLYFNKCIY